MKALLRALPVVLAGAVWCPPALAQQPETGAYRMSLDDAIAEALIRSPALAPAQESVAMAGIGRERARSEFGLRVSPRWATTTDALGSGTEVGLAIQRRLPSGTRLRLEGDVRRGGLAGSDDWARSYALTIEQPLLAGFGPGPTARLRDAERGVVSSERAFQQGRRDLVVRVAQAYFGVVRQQRLAAAAERALERARRLREASEARTRVGLATRLDVLRADLLGSQASAQLEAQREALAASLDQLKVLLGRPLLDPLVIEPSAIVVASPGGAPRVDVDALVASAMASRLDLRELRDRVGDADRATSIARWSLLPDLTVEATYAARASAVGTALDLGLTPHHGWRVRVGSTYAFDQAGARASLASAEIATQAARRRLDDVEQAVEADVRRAARAVARAAASIAIQETAVTIAEQQLALAEMRYERGLAGNFDVIDAESNLFQAETALIAAQVDRALAALVLENAAGTLDPERYLR